MTPEERKKRIVELEAKINSIGTQPQQQFSSLSQNPYHQQLQRGYESSNIGGYNDEKSATDYGNLIYSQRVGEDTARERGRGQAANARYFSNDLVEMLRNNPSLRRGDVTANDAQRIVDRSKQTGLRFDTGKAYDERGNRITEEDAYTDAGRFIRGIFGKKNLLAKRDVRQGVQLSKQMAGDRIYEAEARDVYEGKVQPFNQPKYLNYNPYTAFFKSRTFKQGGKLIFTDEK